MAAIGQWIVGLAASALLAGLALAVTPKGRVRNVLKLVTGVVMLIALVSPVLHFDLSLFSVNAEQSREELQAVQNSVNDAGKQLNRDVIEQECAAYILDKAQDLGIKVEAVSVTAKWGDEGVFYPYEAHITAQLSPDEKGALARAIEAELGIAPERQYWNGNEA
ncbi:MAG: stage III sporulation protein AF [Firmicutes bacterium]|nr:stage III sporulation protein AF [Bacillota bacterium]